MITGYNCKPSTCHILVVFAAASFATTGCINFQQTTSATQASRQLCPPIVAPKDNRSFADAAKQELVKRLSDILENLRLIAANTMPHEVKSLRRDIGDLKMLIDIFRNAYPEKPNADYFPNEDTASASVDTLRKELDKGYEAYGQFKDLFDTQGIDASYDLKTKKWSTGREPPGLEYDPGDVEKLRKEVLRWTKNFTDAGVSGYFSMLLREPLTDRLANISNDEQARLFWGSVNIEPKLKLTASQNLRRLVGALAGAANKNFEKVLEIKNPIKDANAYHDLRKRLRAMAKIMSFFPDVVSAEEVKAIQTDFLATSGEMGELFDKIVALERMGDEKSKKKIEAVLDDWKKMKNGFKKSDLDRRLERLSFIMGCE